MQQIARIHTEGMGIYSQTRIKEIQRAVREEFLYPSSTVIRFTAVHL